LKISYHVQLVRFQISRRRIVAPIIVVNVGVKDATYYQEENTIAVQAPLNTLATMRFHHALCTRNRRTLKRIHRSAQLLPSQMILKSFAAPTTVVSVEEMDANFSQEEYLNAALKHLHTLAMMELHLVYFHHLKS
jgi:hypothetical protein